jgi:hypothetical protein
MQNLGKRGIGRPGPPKGALPLISFGDIVANGTFASTTRVVEAVCVSWKLTHTVKQLARWIGRNIFVSQNDHNRMTDFGSFIFNHVRVKHFGTKDHSRRRFTTDQL